MSLFYEVLYWLIKNCLYLVDCIMEVFGALSGLTSVTVSGENREVYLLEYLVTNKSVQTVFFVIAGISIFVALCFTIISVIKNAVVTKHKSQSKTLFEFLMTTISTLLTAFALLAIIWLANEILQLIDLAFNNGNDYTLGQTIMNICAGQQIDWGDRAVNGFSFGDSPNAFFGELEPAWMGILYDVNTPGEGGVADITTFNFLTATIASVAMLIVMIQAVLGLTARIFNIVFIYLCAPLIIATVPLDDGARFKLWRETAISKVLLAYGTVLAVNIFILVLPIITTITIQSVSQTVNDLFILILVVCGAFTIPAGQLLFARLIGTQAEENRETTSGLRSMFATALGTGRMVAGAKRAVFGGTNRYGRQTGGLLRGGAKMGAKTVNAAGTFIGGNAYRAGVAKMKTNVKELKNSLKGKFMEGNGIAGMAHRAGQPVKRAAQSAKGVVDAIRNGIDIGD